MISASALGKLKTAAQVAMVMVLIAFDDRPLWISLLVYATVAITVFSGADYFFGFRRLLREGAGTARTGAPDAGA
ncbi:MAG TPA: hypothetical protein VG371_08845 [Solirubrobacteraceae bacterium]|nr:hypothetical protein [Solirubrobacteraceae bacterium]